MTDPLNPDEGEEHQIEGDESGIVDTPDGGAIVELEEEANIEASAEHFANLADGVLDAADLKALAVELIDLIDEDKESRKKRDEIYAEGIKRTGLGDEAPGGADFEGASKVVHPLLTEVCVDFSARVMKELFPAAGPVKQHIPGTTTKDKLEKSRRKAKYMNWQLTKQMKEFRSELEQTLTQVPLGGAAYMKVSYDAKLKRPTSEFIPIDDIIYPFAASSFMSAERKTHARKITQLKYQRYVKSGVYLDVDVVAPDTIEETKSAEASHKIEGKTADPYNSDGLRLIYETTCYLDIEEEDEFRPYVVTIDETTKQILAVYRNWDEQDENDEELSHIVEFPFVPWRGASPIGITHMIGSISGAATGALRALLDSAHINNMPGGVKLAGGMKGGQKLSPKATEIVSIEGSTTVDDIRKLFMPLPFNPPSETLFKLLGFLIEAGKGVIQTTFEGIADQKTDMPVGTTLALIEQGMTVFSAIHARLHNSMMQVLEIIHRINSKHMTSQEEKDELGEVVAMPKDFQGAMDVIPVSDPNIFSEVQRQAQIALIAARSQLPTNLQQGMYNLRRVEKLILDYAKIPAPDELLNPAKEPMRDNAVNENVKATMGNSLVVFPEQNHEAHISTHMGYMLNPIFGSSPLVAPTFIPAIVSHLRDHLAFWYVSMVEKMASEEAQIPISKLMDQDEEVSHKFDDVMLKYSEKILSGSGQNQTLAALPPVIQKAIEFIKANSPPPIMDPSAVAAQEVQRKSARDAQDAQMAQAKNAQDAQLAQQESQQAAQAQQMELQHKAQLAQLTAQQKREKDAMDAQIAQRKLENDGVALANDRANITLKAHEIDQKNANAQSQLSQDQQQFMAEQLENKATTQFVEAAESQRTDQTNQVKLQINEADNETAMTIVKAEIASGEKTSMKTGGGINPQ